MNIVNSVNVAIVSNCDGCSIFFCMKNGHLIFSFKGGKQIMCRKLSGKWC